MEGVPLECAEPAGGRPAAGRHAARRQGAVRAAWSRSAPGRPARRGGSAREACPRHGAVPVPSGGRRTPPGGCTISQASVVAAGHGCRSRLRVTAAGHGCRSMLQVTVSPVPPSPLPSSHLTPRDVAQPWPRWRRALSCVFQAAGGICLRARTPRPHLSPPVAQVLGPGLQSAYAAVLGEVPPAAAPRPCRSRPPPPAPPRAALPAPLCALSCGVVRPVGK